MEDSGQRLVTRDQEIAKTVRNNNISYNGNKLLINLQVPHIHNNWVIPGKRNPILIRSLSRGLRIPCREHKI